VPVAGTDHFTVLEALRAPTGALLAVARGLI